MTRSAPRTSELEHAAARAPRHSVERFVRCGWLLHRLSLQRVAVQLRDGDTGPCAVGLKLHCGFDVSGPPTPSVMPSPTPANELRRRTVRKWLNAIQALRLCVCQLLGKGSSLNSGQPAGVRQTAVAPD